jgi:hypothetical protein
MSCLSLIENEERLKGTIDIGDCFVGMKPPSRNDVNVVLVWIPMIAMYPNDSQHLTISPLALGRGAGGEVWRVLDYF